MSEAETQCQKCLQSFHPRTKLTCQDTICISCLNKVVDGTDFNQLASRCITCPLCSEILQIEKCTWSLLEAFAIAQSPVNSETSSFKGSENLEYQMEQVQRKRGWNSNRKSDVLDKKQGEFRMAFHESQFSKELPSQRQSQPFLNSNESVIDSFELESTEKNLRSLEQSKMGIPQDFLSFKRAFQAKIERLSELLSSFSFEMTASSFLIFETCFNAASFLVNELEKEQRNSMNAFLNSQEAKGDLQKYYFGKSDGFNSPSKKTQKSQDLEITEVKRNLKGFLSSSKVKESQKSHFDSGRLLEKNEGEICRGCFNRSPRGVQCADKQINWTVPKQNLTESFNQSAKNLKNGFRLERQQEFFEGLKTKMILKDFKTRETQEKIKKAALLNSTRSSKMTQDRFGHQMKNSSSISRVFLH